MHLIQSLKNEFCFDLPMFSKYPATSINNYFFKMTLHDIVQCLIYLDIDTYVNKLFKMKVMFVPSIKKTLDQYLGFKYILLWFKYKVKALIYFTIHDVIPRE